MLLTPYFLGPFVLFLRLPSFFLLCPAPLRLPAPAWPLPPRYELALTARPILFQFFSAWTTCLVWDSVRWVRCNERIARCHLDGFLRRLSRSAAINGLEIRISSPEALMQT